MKRNSPYLERLREIKLGLKPAGGKTETQKEADKVKAAAKDAAGAWYDQQLMIAPQTCENCKAHLRESMGINPRTIVCHIVPKARVKSVATHALNRWFGCSKCHNVYDTGGEKAAKMPVLKKVIERYKQFAQLIPQEERQYIPKFLPRYD